MHRVKEIKKTLIGWVECEVAKGMECFDCEACGEVVDMIKDLAETEKSCMEAAYYSTVMDAMEGAEEHARRQGYDNWRYSSSGQFAPKGKGTYNPGYTPTIEHPMPPKYNYPEGNEQYAGYSRGGNGGGGSRGGSSGGNSGDQGGSSGFTPGISAGTEYPWSDRGMRYDMYKMAKRHYTESKSTEDFNEMNKRLSENVSNVVGQIREMAQDASPESRKKLKMEVNELVAELNQMV